MRGRGSKRRRHILTIGVFLLLWSLVIFSFSAQSYDEQDIKPLIRHWVPQEVMEQLPSDLRFEYGEKEINIRSLKEEGIIEFFIRKIAHFLIFAILGVLFALILHILVKRASAYIYAWMISLIFACLDEWHQSFVPNRTPSFEDIVLDMMGATVGVLVTAGLRKLSSKRKTERE